MTKFYSGFSVYRNWCSLIGYMFQKVWKVSYCSFSVHLWSAYCWSSWHRGADVKSQVDTSRLLEHVMINALMI